MPLLAPTGRRNHTVNSTSARTPISLSSRIQAPHIMGRQNMHWDLTSSAMPTGCASADATRRSLPRQRADRQAPPAVRFRTVDVQDLFEDSRRAPVSRLAPGYTVYRRPRMDEEGVPANAQLV